MTSLLSDVQLGFGALFKICFGQFSGSPNFLSSKAAQTLHCDRTLVYAQNVKHCVTVEIMNVKLLVLVDFCDDLTFYSYKPNCFSSRSLTKQV